MTYMVIPSGRYSVVDVLARPSLNDLVALKLATGFGMQTLRTGLAKFDQLSKEAAQRGASMGDLSAIISEDLNVLEAFKAFIWLARRAAGEQLTVDDACNFPFSELRLVGDDEPAADVETDPTMPATDSGPAAEQ